MQSDIVKPFSTTKSGNLCMAACMVALNLYDYKVTERYFGKYFSSSTNKIWKSDKHFLKKPFRLLPI